MSMPKYPVSRPASVPTSPGTRGPRGTGAAGDPSGKRTVGATPGPTGHAGKGDPVCPADLALHDLSLEYQTVDADVLKFTMVSATPIAGSKTLARHGQSLLLHANNRIIVRSQGRPMDCALSIYRVWRVWFAPLDPATGQRTDDYVTGGSTKWTNDATGITSWYDVPGQKVSPDAANRPPQRHLVEFLVGILNHPEAGGIYFHILIDVLPGKFRVSMSRELAFHGKAWSNLFPFEFDFHTTQSASGVQEEVAVSTVTHKPFADENGGLPIALDYGWTKFP